MKIKPEDLTYLRECIQPLDTPELRAAYRKQSNSDMGYRWYLLVRVARVKIGDGVGVKGDIDLYAYLNDDHIDTALRKIVPPLEK
jgi:hypothetical protein